jgi:hypothetical protein
VTPRAVAPNKRAKAAKKTAPNTALTLAPAPRKGGARLPVGNHPKNTGGKKGRSGRKPDEFKAMMRELVSHDDATKALKAILSEPGHPQYVSAYRMAAEFGYGKASQPVEHTGEGGGPISVTVTHRVIDP